MARRWLCLACALLMLWTALPAGAADKTTKQPKATATPAVRWSDSQPFGIRHGPRDKKRVAITMDDCYQREIVQEAFELVEKYGGAMTFFPLGDQLKKKDAKLWQSIAQSKSEIGSHTNHHTRMTKMSYNGICIHLYRVQEILDSVLGYHYGIVSVRPPFGSYANSDGTTNANMKHAFNHFGYEHAVLWDVSQTDPEKAKKAVQNGSILLYHARNKDMKCLRELIPWLVEQGYELVTVNELLQLGDIKIGGDPYVYDRKKHVWK